jgi:uncharacterized protein YneF (UPF0154 family)
MYYDNKKCAHLILWSSVKLGVGVVIGLFIIARFL